MPDVLPVDFPALAVDSLPSRYLDAVNFRALVQVYANAFQAIDNVALQLEAQGGITDAEGVQLDQIGQLIGQPRPGGAFPGGVDDAQYRRYLYARQAVNNSHGTAPELVTILQLLLGDQLTWAWPVDTPPAAFVLSIWVTSPLEDWQKQMVIEFMTQAKAAGVGMRIIVAVTPIFAYDGFPSPPGLGYDDGSGTVGGYWADYIY